MMKKSLALAVALAAALARTAAAQAPTESVWQAISGTTPDAICPAWTLQDTAPGADPVLAAGALTLSTAANAEDMFYFQPLDVTPSPDPLVFEFRVRFVSGATGVVNRAPIAIVVTTAPNVGTLFFVDADEIFLVGDGEVVGQTASVDTDGAGHTYRVEVTAAGAVSVSYDGTPTLTGATFTSAPSFGASRRIIWGEGSISARGTHAWESFAHNGTACGSGTTTTSLAPAPTTTSTTVVGATTTTLPSADCEEAVPGSLVAVRCRLEALRGRIENEDLGKYRAKLLSTLGKAMNRGTEGMTACESADDKTARRRVKQLQKFLTKMSHKLRGLAARKQLDGAVRTELIGVIDSIKSEASALRGAPCA
jgi:hypothetical protein